MLSSANLLVYTRGFTRWRLCGPIVFMVFLLLLRYTTEASPAPTLNGHEHASCSPAPPPTSTSAPSSLPCVDRGAIDSSDVPPGLADSPFGWLLLCYDDRDDGHGRAADYGDTRTCMSPSPVGAPGSSALRTLLRPPPNHATCTVHADA